MCKLSLHNALEWSFAMRSNGLSVFIALNTLLIFLLGAAMMSNATSVSAQGVRQVATPTFSARPPISAANVQRVTELRRLGFGFINEVRYSLDGKSLAVAGSAGIWLYNAQDLSAAPRLLTGHADTVSDLLLQARSIRPCACGTWRAGGFCRRCENMRIRQLQWRGRQTGATLPQAHTTAL
jgi:hypothetical protein